MATHSQHAHRRSEYCSARQQDREDVPVPFIQLEDLRDESKYTFGNVSTKLACTVSTGVGVKRRLTRILQ